MVYSIDSMHLNYGHTMYHTSNLSLVSNFKGRATVKLVARHVSEKVHSYSLLQYIRLVLINERYK